MVDQPDLAFLQRQVAALGKGAGRQFGGGGNPPDDGDMHERVVKLETHFDYVRRDLDGIKADNQAILGKLDAIAESVLKSKAETAADIATIARRFGDAQSIIVQRFAELPTKRELRNYTLTELAVGLAIIAIVITGIVGGLDWIKSH